MGKPVTPEAIKRKAQYNQAYAKKFFKTKLIQFNTNIPEDIAMLDWIKKQPEGGNAYIKRLIKEDIERRASQN